VLGQKLPCAKEKSSRGKGILQDLGCASVMGRDGNELRKELEEQRQTSEDGLGPKE
jgi:hypothetical protein